MKSLIRIMIFIVLILLSGCWQEKNNELNTDNQETLDFDTIERKTHFQTIETDKSRYTPGETVIFSLQLSNAITDGNLWVRTKHLNQIYSTHTVNFQGNQAIWEWDTPNQNNTGYMIEVYLQSDDHKLIDHMNIAVDVSSDWGKFPRYGYLADFHAMDNQSMETVISRLNRFHINGVQFYDWQFKHHQPVKWNKGLPANQWPDIANRPVSFDTVKGYIQLAQARNMKTMNYNLLFGAYSNAEIDGVNPEWALFKDGHRVQQDKHPLPDSWASDIYILDPSNKEWRDYIIREEKKVFEVLPFDGWHVDQLGDRGPVFDYEGNLVSLTKSYSPFIKQAQQELQVDFVMNAVEQFGQIAISEAPVKFLYTEVWNRHPGYISLKDIIDQNNKISNGSLNTVLAAYVNYDLSNAPGSFNPPGVLFANAVIFASGGSHLSIGENMLSKEYFPHKNLIVPAELELKLIDYYDFLVAYQNLLRDEVTETALEINASSEVKISSMPSIGSIWTFSKRKDNRDILQLINFTEAAHLKWNDTAGDQKQPSVMKDITFTVAVDREIKEVWFASPDVYHGSATNLEFIQEGEHISFTLPNLEYWSMVVIE
jgi:dextranase